MKSKRLLIAFFVLVAIPAVALALQSQRAQLGITIIVNVTPNPLGYTRNNAPAATDTAIVAKATLRGAPAPLERTFEAQQLHFVPAADGVLVAQVQKSLKVEAEVTPNPTATLLTTDAPGTTVTVSGMAGAPFVVSCAYRVIVDTTISNWQLKDGLSADFAGTPTKWPGIDVAKNTYPTPGPPNPTSTPFVVYANNGGQWAIVNGAFYSGAKTFCVDLTFNIPIATPQGTYSSNAIYTLYY